MSFAGNRQIAPYKYKCIAYSRRTFSACSVFCVQISRYKEMSFKEILCVSTLHRNAPNFDMHGL
jgi:hypothetical protein